jgi:DNA-binding protein
LAEVRKETSQLLSFLEVIAKRKKGEKVPLSFGGKFLKTAIVMVSEESKFLERGVQPYALAVAKEIAQDADLIYIVAWGSKVKNAIKVIEFLQEKLKMTLLDGTDKTYVTVHENVEIETVCAALIPKKE